MIRGAGGVLIRTGGECVLAAGNGPAAAIFPREHFGNPGRSGRAIGSERAGRRTDRPSTVLGDTEGFMVLAARYFASINSFAARL